MSYRNRILWSSIFGLGLESIDIMMLSFTLTSIMATFGLSGAQGGMISTVTNIGMLLGGIMFGLLADKYGRIKIFSYSILLFSIATGVLPAACRRLARSFHLRYHTGFSGGCGSLPLAGNSPMARC